MPREVGIIGPDIMSQLHHAVKIGTPGPMVEDTGAVPAPLMRGTTTDLGGLIQSTGRIGRTGARVQVGGEVGHLGYANGARRIYSDSRHEAYKDGGRRRHYCLMRGQADERRTADNLRACEQGDHCVERRACHILSNVLRHPASSGDQMWPGRQTTSPTHALSLAGQRA